MSCWSVLRLQNFKKEELPLFCRACACELNETYEIENNPAKPELPLLLQRYVPEFDIKVENACLCFDCVSTLYSFHNFKRKCLRTEQDLRLHIRKHPDVKTVNLNDIFVPKEQANNPFDGVEPSLGTTAITEETIMKGPISDIELVLVPERTIKEEITEPPQTVTTEFICEFCSRVFSRRQSLLCHKEKCHRLLHYYKCEKCSKPFAKKKSYDLHMTYHNKIKHYNCHKCSREFALEKAYHKHLEYHKKPAAGRFTCEICNFVYHTYDSLKVHNIAKHMSDDKKRFQCKVCAKRFVEKHALTIHMRTHTGEKPYKCPLCTYASATKSCVYKHVRKKHIGNKVQFNGETCVIIQ